METLTNSIHQDFMKYEWIYSTSKKPKDSNRVCYKVNNQITNPYDEISIEYLPHTNQYEIIVPIGSVPYKKTFTDATITCIAEYIRMHLDYYYSKKMTF
jgi:hypothetical protein